MAISTNITNRIALEVVTASCFVGGGAFAGAALGPVGTAGGALFGATSFLARRGTVELCKKIVNLGDPRLNQATRIMFFAIQLFAIVGSGMLALTLAGFTITVGSTVSLTLLSTIGFVFVHSILECCCGDFKAPVGGPS